MPTQAPQARIKLNCKPAIRSLDKGNSPCWSSLSPLSPWLLGSPEADTERRRAVSRSTTWKRGSELRSTYRTPWRPVHIIKAFAPARWTEIRSYPYPVVSFFPPSLHLGNSRPQDKLQTADNMVLTEYTYVFVIGTGFALLEAFNNGASMCDLTGSWLRAQRFS